MNIEKNIKLWSSLGMRATFGLIAMELAKINSDLMITTSDVSTSAGLDRYRNKYPDQFVDVGIAEQNLIGVSAGLSSEGFKVISTTFAPFQTLRCCEQIKVNLGYMGQKICMVGIASGLALGTLGFTHCCIEDVGILRSIPGITIISPADSLETVKALEKAVKSESPSYIRLTGSSNNPIVYKEDYDYEKVQAERQEDAITTKAKKLYGEAIWESDKSINYFAFHKFKEAADLGHMDSQYLVAMAYKSGLGVKFNSDLAGKYFKLAAAQGHKEAKKWYELHYKDGYVFEKPTGKIFITGYIFIGLILFAIVWIIFVLLKERKDK